MKNILSYQLFEMSKYDYNKIIENFYRELKVGNLFDKSLKELVEDNPNYTYKGTNYADKLIPDEDVDKEMFGVDDRHFNSVLNINNTINSIAIHYNGTFDEFTIKLEMHQGIIEFSLYVNRTHLYKLLRTTYSGLINAKEVIEKINDKMIEIIKKEIKI
jgi:hypothetical protein